MSKIKHENNYRNRSKISFKKIIYLYKSPLPTTKIAKLAGISATRVHKILKDSGVKMRTKIESEKLKRKYNYNSIINDYKNGMKLNLIADKFGIDFSGAFKIIKKANIYRGRLTLYGADNPNWKGGTHTGGYIRNKNGWLHRLDIEKAISRKLEHWENVHHIDGNKYNYELSNLVVLPSKEHIRFHTFLRQANLNITFVNLKKFCRRERRYEYRFTKECLKKACSKLGIILKSINPKKRGICKICGKPNVGLGFCSMHYQRYKAKKCGYWLSSRRRKSDFLGKYTRTNRIKMLQ